MLAGPFVTVDPVNWPLTVKERQIYCLEIRGVYQVSQSIADL